MKLFPWKEVETLLSQFQISPIHSTNTMTVRIYDTIGIGIAVFVLPVPEVRVPRMGSSLQVVLTPRSRVLSPGPPEPGNRLDVVEEEK